MRSSADGQGRIRSWPRRAIAGLAIVAGLTLAIGGQYWQAPDRSDPAPPQSVIVAAEEFPTASPGAAVRASSLTPSPSADPVPFGVATRLVITSLDVDLPVLSSAFVTTGNPDSYPLCDVAQYLTDYGQPGSPGTMYLYGHARKGMLAPLLQASEVDNGAALLGQQVLVYAADGWVFSYRIFLVKRHATDFSVANNIAPGEERLVIQTSEGPSGTVPKLQIAAQRIWRQNVGLSPALPSPDPRVCAPGT